MANITVTYSFSNGTAADATQVNQNFSDIIAGTSDGTKDFSISALTCAGNVTLNGNTTIGNASSDDLTITASLASSIAIKTTFSYDIGTSTIGLRDIYLGDAGSAARTTKIRGATVAASWTFTLPTSGGTDQYVMRTNGSGVSSWTPVYSGPYSAENYALTCTVNASALTITLDGASAAWSSTNPGRVSFRNVTATSGTPSELSLTSSIAITVNSTATLGWTSGSNCYAWVYIFNDGGTARLGISSQWQDDSSVASATAIGTGADDNAFYASAGITSKSFRLLGRIKYATAPNGTYAAIPDEVSLAGHGANLRVETRAEATTSSDTATVNASTYYDITSLTLTLQPGVYNIGYHGSLLTDYAAGGTLTGSGNIVIRYNSTTLLSPTSLLITKTLGAGTDEISCPVAASTRVTVTTTTTYIVSMQWSRASTASRLLFQGTGGTSGDGALWAERVA